MAVINADVLRVFDTPANLTANLKAGMFAYDTTNDRLAVKRLADSTMLYVSEDTKQCLLAGVQTITGAKTFSADLTVAGALIAEKTWGAKAITQTITGDNQLLNSDVASYLYVDASTSGAPTSYTCGMKAGYDGQIITIQIAENGYAIEIDPTVASSAAINFRGDTTKLTLTTEQVAQFVWNATENQWILLYTDTYLDLWPFEASELALKPNDKYLYGYNTSSVKKKIIGINASDKVEIDGSALGAVCSGDLSISKSLFCSKETNVGVGGSTDPGTTIPTSGEFYCTIAPTGATDDVYTINDGTSNGQIMMIRNIGAYTAHINNIDDGGNTYIGLPIENQRIMRWSTAEDRWIVF